MRYQRTRADRSRIGQILLRSETVAMEVFAALVALWWAGLLLSPMFSWDVTRSYDAMRILPATVWGLAALMFGLMQAAGILLQSYRLRKWGAFLAAPFWAFVAVMLGVANPFVTGVGVYALFSAACCWVFWRGPYDLDLVDL